MKKKLKRIFALLAFSVVASTTLLAQMTTYTLPPRKFDVSYLSGSGVGIPGAASTQHIVSNGAYDASNNLLFYITNKTIYTSNSTAVATLPSFYIDGNPNNQDCSNAFTNIGPEISIVPVPGACQKYYVIYSVGNCSASAATYLAAQIMYVTVDCSSGTPSMSGAVRIDQTGGGIAVTKLIGGSYRFLFTFGAIQYQINRYIITSTGISFSAIALYTSNYPSAFDSNGPINELEISPNGQYLAWGNIATGKKVKVVTFNSNYAIVGAVGYGSFDNIKGVEFDATSSRLFVSSSTGISYLQMSSGAITSVASSSAYNNTGIELSSAGALYFVSSSTGTLGRINSPNGSATISAFGPSGTIYSNGASVVNAGDNAYRLNDQIDGENYTYFGTPYASANGSDFCNRTVVTATAYAYTGSIQWETRWACPDANGNPPAWTNVSGGNLSTLNITSASSVGGTFFRAKVSCGGSQTYTNTLVVYGVGCGQAPGSCPWSGGALQAATDENSESSVFAVSVYPNPSAGLFKLDAAQDITSVEVYNTLGALVFKNTTIDAKQTAVDISSQPVGMYFMKVTNASGKVLNKTIAIQ